MCEADPLSVFLVKSGSKGDRLIFRYPFSTEDRRKILQRKNKKSLHSLITEGKDDLCSIWKEKFNDTIESGLYRFDDKVLSNLFTVKSELCGQKFELKIENIRFVGHPTQVPYAANREPSTIRMFSVVFALKACATYSIVNCYHDLSFRLAIAILHEEQRCGYLTSQVKLMQVAHDETASQPEACEESPYNLILCNSQLAMDLKTAYDDLKSSGAVHLKINKWMEVSFCLPNKVHKLHDMHLSVEPEAIQNSLASLRPYHGVLLLVNANELLQSLPEDASPALVRLIRVTNPLKNLQQLAADADIILSGVFQLVGHLVYWAKATVIYPLCNSNVYVLSPNAPTSVKSPLVEMFSERFPGMHFLSVLSQFSLPTSLSNLTNPINLPYQQAQQVQMVVWMLQHRLLKQLHTYVYLVSKDQSILSTSNNNHHYDNDPWFQDKKSTYSEFGSSYPGEESPTGSPSHSKSGSEEDVSVRDEGSLFLDDVFSTEQGHQLSKEDVNSFKRLRPYFKGRHHLEEIMYIENIRRSQLLALLDKFRSVLITCQYEDAAVAAFCNYT